MKILALTTLLLVTKAFSAPVPSSELPQTCRLKSDFVEVGQIYGARSTKTYRYKSAVCIKIQGSNTCLSYFPESCSLEQEDMELKLPDGRTSSYGSVDEICRDYSEEILKGVEVKCESKVGRTITYGGRTPFCNESVDELNITVLKKLSGDDLKDAKCQAITSCLEKGLGFFERRNARRWANYYGCNN